MTLITPADYLPSEIVTLEKATYHNLLALYQLYGNLEFAANVDDRQALRITSAVGKGFDGAIYNIYTASFQLDELISTSNPTNKKPWMAALDWGNVTYPAAFKQNSPT